MSNGSIVTCVGSSTNLFKDRESYPYGLCSSIESIVSINLPELSYEGGRGRIRFLDSNNNELVQLNIHKGYSRMSDESKSVILISDINNSIKSNIYYGIDCEVDFDDTSQSYSLSSDEGHVESIRNFYNAIKFTKGGVGAAVILVDRLGVFEKLLHDDFFNKCYILYSE